MFAAGPSDFGLVAAEIQRCQSVDPQTDLVVVVLVLVETGFVVVVVVVPEENFLAVVPEIDFGVVVAPEESFLAVVPEIDLGVVVVLEESSLAVGLEIDLVVGLEADHVDLEVDLAQTDPGLALGVALDQIVPAVPVPEPVDSVVAPP
jgi:hypothetical protein